MWHSHNEREITTNNVFPGGMLMMMLVDSREFVIDESHVSMKKPTGDVREKNHADEHFKAILKIAARVLAILSFAAAAAFGQQTINLTAAPDHRDHARWHDVPMWGYSCGAAVTGSTATCAALNPRRAATTAADVVSRGDYRAGCQRGSIDGPNDQSHE